MESFHSYLLEKLGGEKLQGASLAIGMKVKGYTYLEIANVMNIKPPSVCELVRKAVMRLGHFEYEWKDRLSPEYVSFLKRGVQKWGLYYPKQRSEFNIKRVGMKIPSQQDHQRRGDFISPKDNCSFKF